MAQFDAIALDYQRISAAVPLRDAEWHCLHVRLGDLAGLSILDLACGNGMGDRPAGCRCLEIVGLSTRRRLTVHRFRLNGSAQGRGRQARGMRILTDVVDLVFPACCLCCGRPGAVWCARCQPASRPSPVDRPNAPPVYAAGEYAEQLRTALIGYKERGRRQLAGPLAGYLADAVDCAIRATGAPRAPVLVPVPSSRAAARSRGGDHVVRLARAVGRQLELPVLRAVTLTGPVADSAGLSAEQRRSNLAGRMFASSPDAARHRPILVDDIVTTGATLAEAARALAVAGWPPGAAAVVAATRLRCPAPGPPSRAPPVVGSAPVRPANPVPPP